MEARQFKIWENTDSEKIRIWTTEINPIFGKRKFWRKTWFWENEIMKPIYSVIRSNRFLEIKICYSNIIVKFVSYLLWLCYAIYLLHLLKNKTELNEFFKLQNTVSIVILHCCIYIVTFFGLMRFTTYIVYIFARLDIKVTQDVSIVHTLFYTTRKTAVKSA